MKQRVAVESDSWENENKRGNKNKILHVDPWYFIKEHFDITVHITLFFHVTIASADEDLKAGAKWVASFGDHALVYSREHVQHGSLQRVDSLVGGHVGLDLNQAPKEIVEGIAV